MPLFNRDEPHNFPLSNQPAIETKRTDVCRQLPVRHFCLNLACSPYC